MELTTKFIEEKFNQFNKEYWNGTLKKPHFEVMHCKSLLGQFNFVKWLIRVSDKYDRSEKDYCNTIIHEMIHLYIRQNHIKDTNRHHGREFYKEADRLNRFGWHIARTDSVAGMGLSGGQKETYNVAAFKNPYGKYFLMVMNPHKIGYFERRFNSSPSYYKEWFTFKSSDDKKYAHYTKCQRSCRGYFITREDFENLKKENGITTLSIRRSI